jgi:hypothetical protein
LAMMACGGRARLRGRGLPEVFGGETGGGVANIAVVAVEPSKP